MKSSSRGETAASLLMGVLTALLVSMALMALLAFVLVRFDISDVMLTSANQLIKIIAVFAGCVVCVGRGGDKGFARGAATGLIYMILGYALYSALGASAPSNLLLVCEFALGAVIGALSGALAANLKPRKRARRAASA